MRKFLNTLINLGLGAYLYPVLKIKKLRNRTKNIFLDSIQRVISMLNTDKLPGQETFIIDVGAYCGLPGDTTPYFAKAFPQLQVMAFEPFSDSFSQLSENTKKFRNVKPYQIALSDRKGEDILYVTSQSHSASLLNINESALNELSENKKNVFSSVEQQKITLDTLDNFFHNKTEFLIGILKIDTQGSELSVLRGSTNVLKKTILINLEMGNHLTYMNSVPYFAVDEFLRSNGFILADITPSLYEKNIIYEWDAIYVNKNYLEFVNKDPK
jgi:FkbM family methyltransferase